MYRAVRTPALPPKMVRRPLIVPESRFIWNHTDKRTDFTPGEVTLFGYFRQQRSSRHGANTFNTAQSLSKLFEVAMDMAVHVSI